MTLHGTAIELALSRALDRDVRLERRVPLTGGSINRTERLDTTAGSFVLKTHHAPPAGFFHAEARGLDALRRSGTSLVIPQVIACHDSADDERTPAFLIIEFLVEGRRRSTFDTELGRGLAALHRAAAPRFGFAADNFCGATVQPNTWCERWVDFYGRFRLGHQLGLAAQAGLLTTTEIGRIDRLIAHLETWLDEPADGPALIHGDLWSGNLHTAASGQPALLDPAAYYGHREAELGMMTLFGGIPARALDAYDEAFALESGWRERMPLYQLYHLMNHLNLFGASYHTEVMAVVAQFV